MRIPVTVVVPTKNEAKNVARCLTRLSDFERVLVVDSNSSDGTQSIAACNGAEVLNFDWNGQYPKKRNWVLMNNIITTEWVLFLDADELISKEFCLELEEKLRNKDVVAYWITYTNYFLGKKLKFGVPQRKLALFRVGAGLYEMIPEDHWSNLDMEVHEHPVLVGRHGALSTQVEHKDFKSLHRFIERHNDYSSWEAHRIKTMVEKAHADQFTYRQKIKYRFITRAWFAFAYFVFQYVYKLGFLDGSIGFYYAVHKFNYFTNVRQKCMELDEDTP